MNLGEQRTLFRDDLILRLRRNQVKYKTHHKPGMQFDFPPYIPNHLMYWDVQEPASPHLLFGVLPELPQFLSGGDASD